MGATLHGGHGHSHGGGGHGHGHDNPTTSNNISNVDKTTTTTTTSTATTSIPKSKRQENMNVRAAFIHVVSDFMQSLGVFIAALVIYFKPEWSIIDPICTFMFSVLVLVTTIAIMKDALLVSFSIVLLLLLLLELN